MKTQAPQLQSAQSQPPQDLTKKQNFLLKDDLKGLTPEEKTKFYLDLCSFLGLSPITKPFGIYEFQGKETLYIKADAFDQLCAKNKVSRKIVPQQIVTQHGVANQDFILLGEGNEQTYLVKVEASIKVDGELVVAEDIAEVLIKEEKFEWRGFGNDKKKVSIGFHRNTNALMKAITKAYRRAAKKLISLGAVLLEDDLSDSSGIREINLQNGEVIGGKNKKDILDLALPAPWKGFTNLRELDDQDSEKLHTLFVELETAKRSAKGLTEQWGTVFEKLKTHFDSLESQTTIGG